jgi:protein-serine/threonine kinase
MANTRMVPEDFQTVYKIGEGSFSKVYLKTHTLDGQQYAVKVLKRQTENDGDEAAKRIIAATNREVRILVMCAHPAIIQFYAAMQTADDRMYVTEYCAGGDLASLMRLKRVIPVAAARYITGDVAHALNYLHAAPKKTFPLVPGAPLKTATIIHRDVKPQNIVLTEQRRVKLIDFGSASNPLEEIPAGHVMSFVGTIHYMPPEMLENPDNTSPATDFWSLGVVLYEMLVGRRPFEGAYYALMNDIVEKPVEFPAGFDPVAKDLVSQLLVKDPKARLCGSAVLDHPFFEGAKDWSGVDVARFWIRDADWERDKDVKECRVCQAAFTLLRRRHHCRNCGRVVCAACSENVCPIPDSTYRAAERTCDECFSNMLAEAR